MITRTRSFIAATLVVALTACTSAPSGTQTTTPAPSTVAPTTTPAPSTVAPPTTKPEQQTAPFPIATFADISEEPVPEESAAKFRAAVDGLGASGGVSVTVMTAEGTWSGAAGKADDVRDVVVDDQFNIGSVTKSLAAAQVMQLVEAGELSLDDLAADHLPEDLGFDTGEATIRDLLSHRSGVPDYWDAAMEIMSADLQRVWTPAEIMDMVPAGRGTVGSSFGYADVNYRLLGLVVEQVRGRPLAEVLRDGVLAIDGVERLVFQPDERPSEPMAMPGGESTAALDRGGGYLPSLAAATLDGAAGAAASDSPSLARWWRAFCAGEIVSQASVTEMSTFTDQSVLDGGYGLGLFNPAHPFAKLVGHTGVGLGVEHTGDTYGYVAVAGCLPEHEAVIVVLTNRAVRSSDDILGIFRRLARPLVDALASD